MTNEATTTPTALDALERAVATLEEAHLAATTAGVPLCVNPYKPDALLALIVAAKEQVASARRRSVRIGIGDCVTIEHYAGSGESFSAILVNLGRTNVHVMRADNNQRLSFDMEGGLQAGPWHHYNVNADDLYRVQALAARFKGGRPKRRRSTGDAT